MDKFNIQFATQKLREESVTGGIANYVKGPGEQVPQIATKKKTKKEEKDVEPKLAGGKAKVYMKNKWGWEEAPSIPNRPSKGGFIYKQLFEELSKFVKENQIGEEKVSQINFEPVLEVIKQVAEYLGLDLENVMKGDINMRSDVDFSVKNIPNQAINQFDVYLSDDESKFIINVPNSAQSSIPNIVFENLNESYSRFKNETKTRNKPEQFHQAVREVRKKVQEINRLFEYVSRLKEELSEGEGGLKYKSHTEKALSKIKEMVSALNQNVKRFK